MEEASTSTSHTDSGCTGRRPVQALTEGGHADPIARSLHLVAAIAALGNLREEFDHPDIICSLGRSREVRRLPAQLDERHLIFAPLRILLGKLKAVQGLPLPDKRSVDQLCQHYREFITQVCRADQAYRTELLLGRARLYGGQHVYRIPVERAREILGFDEEGRHLLDEFGSRVLETRLGSACIRREGDEPLRPGISAASHALADQIFAGGVVETEVFKVADLRFERPAPEPQERASRLRLLMAAAGEQLASLGRADSVIDRGATHIEERIEDLVVVTPTLEGRTLGAAIEADDQPRGLGYSRALLLNLLLGGAYGRSNNLVVSEEGSLTAIRSPSALTRPVERTREGLLLNFRSILPLLAARDEQIDPAVVAQLRENPPHMVVIDWLSELHRLNTEIAQQEIRGTLTGKDLQRLGLPITVTLQTVQRLHQNLRRLVQLCEQERLTHWALFEALYPAIAELYLRVLSEWEGNPLKAERRLFPESGYLRLDAMLPEDDPLYGRLAAMAPDRVVRDRALSPIRAVEEWIGGLNLLEDFATAEQASIVEEAIFRVTGIQRLTLRAGFNNRALQKVVRHGGKLRQLTLLEAPSVTAHGITGLLQAHSELSICLGLCEGIDGGGLKEIVEYPRATKQIVSLLLDGQPHPIDHSEASALNKLLWPTLKEERFCFAEGLVALGASWTCTDPKQKTLVHFAAECPSIAPLRYLLDNHLSLLNLEAVYSPISMAATALIRAAQLGPIEAIELLCQNGARLEAADKSGFRPIHKAAIRRDGLAAAAVEKLIDLGATPSVQAQDGSTVLHMVAQHANLPCAQMLHRKLGETAFKKLLEIPDTDGKRPLHVALRQVQAPELVAFFIKAGADVNALNAFRYAPAHWAAMNGHSESLSLLVQAGARLDIANVNGHLPFDLALRWGQDAIVEAYVDPTFRDRLKLPPIRRKDMAWLQEWEPKIMDQIRAARARGAVLDQVLLMAKLNNMLIARATLIGRGNVKQMMQCYPFAAEVANAAAHLAEQHPEAVPELLRDYLMAKLESIEGGFLHEVFQLKTQSGHRGYLNAHREELQKIRDGAVTMLREGEDGAAVCAFYTEKYCDLFRTLIEESVGVIGSPPTDIAIFLLGSGARQEMCRNSDLEFGLTVRERSPEIDLYVDKLLHLLNLKVINVGESLCKLLPGSSPPEGFAFDGTLTPLKRPELYGTPAQVAANLLKIADDVILGAALATTHMVYASPGRNNQVYRDFCSESKNALRDGEHTIFRWKNREKRAAQLLRMDVPDFGKVLPDTLDALPGIEVKTQLSRPIQQVVSSLAIYYDLTPSDTIGRLRQLGSKLKLSAGEVDSLVAAYLCILTVRNQMHAHYGDERNYALLGKEGQTEEVNPFVLTLEQLGGLAQSIPSGRLLLQKVATLVGIERRKPVEAAPAADPSPSDEEVRKRRQTFDPRDGSFLFSLAGEMSKFNTDKGLGILKFAVEAGSPDAQLLLAQHYLSDPKTINDAIPLLEDAANRHRLPGALNTLGMCHLLGVGVPRDIGVAVRCFTAASEQNDPEGLLHQGLCMFSGFGLRWDRADACKMLALAFKLEGDKPELLTKIRLGAGKKNPLFVNALAVCHLEGLGGLPKNEAEGLRLLEEAIAAKWAPALFNLGYCAYHGIGMESDPARAAELAVAASKQEGMVFRLKAKVLEGCAWAAFEKTERGSEEKRLAGAVGAYRKSEMGAEGTPPSGPKAVSAQIGGQVGIERQGLTCWMISLFQALEALPLVCQAVQHPLPPGDRWEERERLRQGFCQLLGAYQVARQEGRTLPSGVIERFLRVAERFHRETGAGQIPWVKLGGGVDAYDPGEFFEMLNRAGHGLNLSQLPVIENFWIRNPEIKKFLPLLDRNYAGREGLVMAYRRLIEAQQEAYLLREMTGLAPAVQQFLQALTEAAGTWLEGWNVEHLPIALDYATTMLRVDDAPYRLHGDYAGLLVNIQAAEAEVGEADRPLWEALRTCVARQGAEPELLLAAVQERLREQVGSLPALRNTGDACHAALLLSARILDWEEEAVAHTKALSREPAECISSLRDLDIVNAELTDPTLYQVVSASPTAIDIASAEEKPLMLFLRIVKKPGVVLQGFTGFLRFGDETAYQVRSIISHRPAAGHYVCYKAIEDGWVLLDDQMVSKKLPEEVEKEAARNTVYLLLERV